VLAGSGLAVLAWRRHPQFSVLWLAHLAILLPVGGYFEHPHYPSDRYSYLHDILWAVVVAATLLWLWRRQRVAAKYALAGTGVLTVVFVAIACRQSNDWIDNEHFFRHTLAELGNDPYRADICWRLAITYLRQDRYPEAIEQADATLALEPRHPLAIRAKAEALMRLAGGAAGDSPRVAAAEAAYMKAAETLAPLADWDRTPATLEMMGIAYTRANHLREAEATFALAVGRFPKAGVLRLRLAQVLYFEGRHDLAWQQLREAVDVDPSAAIAADRIAAMWRDRSPATTAAAEAGGR
jgi:tetratricopeptide (TPR) repeat protein